MQQRIDVTKTAPELYRRIYQVSEYVAKSGLDHKLMELVKIRASQINGCAFCLDMHTYDARKAGETEQRIHCLPAWREVPFYTDAERVALELTEELTQLPAHHVEDELFAKLREHWDDKGICDLIGSIISINAWNRLSVAVRNMPPVRG